MALSPLPGMDPYLEHPALWPDFHNSLIGAIRDALSPLVAPRYSHFPVPLLPGDTEPAVNLGEVLHALYDRARFDLRLDYSGAAVPPVCKEDEDWARRRIAAREPGPSPLA